MLIALMLAEEGAALTLPAVCGSVLHAAAFGIGAIGLGVIVYGVVRETLALIRIEVAGSHAGDRNRLRINLGYYLLLGLEFLVAADVIETLLAPDLEHVLVLGAIVIIRTVISFSLNWELTQHAQQQSRAAVDPPGADANR